MFLIDANVFIELVLDQNRAQECEDFLEKVMAGKIECTVSDFNIDGVLLAIYRETKNPGLLMKFLSTIMTYRGLSFYFVTMSDRLKAIELSESYKLDFEDSMTLQAAFSTGNTIISFDHDFDNLPIKRLEPKDLL